MPSPHILTRGSKARFSESQQCPPIPASLGDNLIWVMPIWVLPFHAIIREVQSNLKSVFTEEYDLLLKRLVSARREAGLTQQQLAGRLNRLQSFVSKYERRERRLDVVELVTVCRALKVDPCSVIREIEDSLNRSSNE